MGGEGVWGVKVRGGCWVVRRGGWGGVEVDEEIE